MIFASTKPINDDPIPWRDRGISGSRHGGFGGWSSDWNPRPEYNRPRAHEANKALLDFRKDYAHAEGFDDIEVIYYYKDVSALSHSHAYSSEEIDHAHKVLTRYMTVFG